MFNSLVFAYSYPPSSRFCNIPIHDVCAQATRLRDSKPKVSFGGQTNRNIRLKSDSVRKLIVRCCSAPDTPILTQTIVPNSRRFNMLRWTPFDPNTLDTNNSNTRTTRHSTHESHFETLCRTVNSPRSRRQGFVVKLFHQHCALVHHLRAHQLRAQITRPSTYDNHFETLCQTVNSPRSRRQGFVVKQSLVSTRE